MSATIKDRPTLNSGFKIAVFGLPGSGKSTIVKKLVKQKSQISWIEVSRDIIGQELQSINGTYKERRVFGQELYRKLCANEGADWAAKRVMDVADSKANVIVTGVRGEQNFERLKSNGYYCVYINSPRRLIAERIAERNKIDVSEALATIDDEERAFSTTLLKRKCHMSIENTSSLDNAEYELYNVCQSISRDMDAIPKGEYCIYCANSKLNSSIFKSSQVVCDVCRCYNSIKNVNQLLNDQREFILNEIKSENRLGRPILVGVSGGKDSSLLLSEMLEFSSQVISFTLDTGYYPLSILRRSEAISGNLGCEHIEFDARTNITDEIRESYLKTAEFFSDEQISGPYFKQKYEFIRKNYSVREKISASYPRPCQLCRRVVIPSYYELARKVGARYVFLGINEWVNLSSTSTTSKFGVSGIRTLQPTPSSDQVYVVHWPFLVRSKVSANKQELERIGWIPPFGENLIETNANSCLFAKASEKIFARKLGFHPDSTRLSREVTAGFLDRNSAIQALASVHKSLWSVGEVLSYAGII